MRLKPSLTLDDAKMMVLECARASRALGREGIVDVDDGPRPQRRSSARPTPCLVAHALFAPRRDGSQLGIRGYAVVASNLR